MTLPLPDHALRRKRGAGPKPKPPEDRATERVMVRFTPGERETIGREAERGGVDVAVFVRRRALGVE